MTLEFNQVNFLDFLVNKEIYSKSQFECALTSYQKALGLSKVDIYCSNCCEMRTFQTTRNLASGGVATGSLQRGNEPTINSKVNETLVFEFICLSCEMQRKTYLLNLKYDHGDLYIEKVGEYPRKPMVKEPTLEKFFKKDKDNYRKAEACLTHGYGVAAFAYYRRIIEANINELIDLIRSDVKITDETKAELDKLHKASRMSENIEVANKALPEYLIQNGINPLGQIYKILSEGVHTLPDEKCLEKADIVRNCLLYLVKEITERKKQYIEFQKTVNKISQE